VGSEVCASKWAWLWQARGAAAAVVLLLCMCVCVHGLDVVSYVLCASEL